MAAKSASSSGDFKKLKRFLYFGHGSNYYQAAFGADFELSLVTGISNETQIVHELLDAEKGEEMVEEISKFLTSNTLGVSRNPALYALAICARHADQTHKTKQAAMKVFISAIDNSADLFSFISYAVRLKAQSWKFQDREDGKNKGWGRSLKTAVRRWFDKRDAMTLARIVTQQKTGCHWSYVDLLRLTHILPKTEGARMITKYLMKGLKAAQEEFGGEKTSGDDSLQQALAYLAAVDQLKAMGGGEGGQGGGGAAGRGEGEGGEVDLELARALVEEHHLCWQQLVTRLQQAPQVLEALVKQMNLQELLENISRLASCQMLEPTCPHVTYLTQRVEDREELKSVHPISLLIASEAYEFGAAREKWTRNNSFAVALKNSYTYTLKENVKATSKRYLVAGNINRRFIHSWSHGVRVLTPGVAAAGVCMNLVENEKSVEVVSFDTQVKPVELKDSWVVSGISDAFLNHGNSSEPRVKIVGDMTAPLTWATNEKKAFDVIIIMTDFRRPKPFSDFPAAFKQYKEAVGVPKAKLIMIGLTANSMSFTSPEEPDMLDIAGFDATVPDLIQRFVTDSL